MSPRPFDEPLSVNVARSAPAVSKLWVGELAPDAVRKMRPSTRASRSTCTNGTAMPRSKLSLTP